MADLKRPLRLEDIPAMNFGKYLLDRMKRFRDQDAVVSGSIHNEMVNSFN